VALRRSIRHRLAIGLVACLTAVAGVLAAPVVALESAGDTAAEPGSAGLGDPYFPIDGNGGYDVQHYDVDVRYEIASARISGTATIRATATQHLSRFNLDLVLGVDAVTVDGAPLTRGEALPGSATYTKPRRHELAVAPGTAIPAGHVFTVTVAYHGTPAAIGYQRNQPWVHGPEEAMATNEPHIAPWWFPANDHPRDKATFDLTIAVPSGNQAISNGELLGTTEGEEWSTWRWRMSDPMAPYLAFFAAGRFEWEQGVSHGLPYVNAVSKGLTPADRTRAMGLMRRSPAIVRWLEKHLGAYPFDSTGGVTTSLHSGFALENQSRPTYPYLGNGSYGRSVVVHELAHQWFGDEVSVHRWRDIWLNEGFASWAEWRYDEAHGGPRAHRTMLEHYAGYPRGDSFWRLSIGDPGPRRLFAYPVYERGAMAVQALRHRIGNADFRELLKTWVQRRADRTGRVGQFRRLAESISDERLGTFFNAWLHTKEKPRRTAANGLR
jgi:aminopeptidase N